MRKKHKFSNRGVVNLLLHYDRLTPDQKTLFLMAILADRVPPKLPGLDRVNRDPA
jgi:hypothetical protein